MFGPSSHWKQSACHVPGCPGRQETGAELDRESLATTFFSSQLEDRKISKRSLKGKLIWPSEAREWLSKNCMKLMRRLRRKIGKREILKLLFERSIKNLNLSDFSHIKQVDGQIRLKETNLACLENWYWETGSSKKIMQGIAKKLKNWEEFVSKKLIEQDKQDLMHCVCNNRGILRLWVRWWLRFGNYRTKWIPCQMQENFRSWIREQLWSDPRSWSNFYDSESQNFAVLRFWIAARHKMVRVLREAFWSTTCSRRTAIYNLPHWKEFGIFTSGIETWYFRERWKENHWIRRFHHFTSKVKVECWIILVEHISSVVWWIIREFIYGIEFWKISWPWNFKAGRSTSELERTFCAVPIRQTERTHQRR